MREADDGNGDDACDDDGRAFCEVGQHVLPLVLGDVSFFFLGFCGFFWVFWRWRGGNTLRGRWLQSTGFCFLAHGLELMRIEPAR